jgi:hypothetical protein
MILHDALLVTFVKLVDRLPMPAQPSKGERGQPRVYSDRNFLKAFVIMMVRHVHKVNEVLSVLAQPTAAMAILRSLLSEQDRFPSRRTWERRLKALPATEPAHIGYLLKAIRKRGLSMYNQASPNCSPQLYSASPQLCSS